MATGKNSVLAKWEKEQEGGTAGTSGKPQQGGSESLNGGVPTSQDDN